MGLSLKAAVAAAVAISVERSLINVLASFGLQVDWPDESRSFFTREDGSEFVQVAGLAVVQTAAEGIGEGTVE